MHRRKILISTCIGVVPFAGCTGSENENDDGANDSMDTGTSTSGNGDGNTEATDEDDIVVKYTPQGEIWWEDVPEVVDDELWRGDWRWVVGEAEVVEGEFDATDILEHTSIGHGPETVTAITITSSEDGTTLISSDEEYMVGPGDTIRMYDHVFDHVEPGYDEHKKWTVERLQEHYDPVQFRVEMQE